MKNKKSRKNSPRRAAKKTTSPATSQALARRVGSNDQLPAVTTKVGERALTAKQFQGLANVPPEVEWFANIGNPRTRRAYKIDIEDFTRFVGIARPEEFRIVTRAHIIAWRKLLEQRIPKHHTQP